MDQGNGTVCRHHSGINKQVEVLEKDNTIQWNHINTLENRTISILVAVILTLIATVIDISIRLLR